MKHIFLIHCILYLQVLSHSEETSQETDSDTHNKTDRKQYLIYRAYRQEIDDILQNAESCHNKFHCLIIQEVQQRQRDCGTEYTNDQTLDHKRRPDHKGLLRRYIS